MFLRVRVDIVARNCNFGVFEDYWMVISINLRDCRLSLRANLATAGYLLFQITLMQFLIATLIEYTGFQAYAASLVFSKLKKTFLGVDGFY